MATPGSAPLTKLWKSVSLRSGAIILVVLLGLLPVRAWAQGTDHDITVERSAEGFKSVTWTGSIAADGRIAVRVHYDLDETPRTFDLRVPPGAMNLAVDDVPTAADVGRHATVEIDASVTITYELAGRVRRYRDGALVVLAGANGDEDPVLVADRDGSELSLSGDSGLFGCPHCFLSPTGYGDTPVFAALYAPGAAHGTVLVNGLDPVRREPPAGAEASADAITLLGSDVRTDDVSLLAVIPADAVPDIERSEGDVASALAAFRTRFSDSDDRFRVAELADRLDRTPAWILTALFALLVLVLVAGPRLVTRSDRTARRSPERQGSGTEVPRLSKSTRPSDLSPAMAALVVRPDHDQSFVAATILDLVNRHIIRLSGKGHNQFTLTIPVSPNGASDFERQVLTQMRPLGVQPDPPKETQIVAPPVWHTRTPIVARALGRAVIREGIRTKLVRRNRLPLLIVPIAIAMGVVTLSQTDGMAFHAWSAIIIGTAIGFVSAARAGILLTASGREQRDIWTDFASWLSGDSELERAEVRDVWKLGEVLVYAVALGAAPRVARALSPGRNGQP
ncbi:MAG: hypothetical protein ABIR32_15220 [Ilumatobacteraceae bacterium]